MTDEQYLNYLMKLDESVTANHPPYTKFAEFDKDLKRMFGEWKPIKLFSNNFPQEIGKILLVDESGHQEEATYFEAILPSSVFKTSVFGPFAFIEVSEFNIGTIYLGRYFITFDQQTQTGGASKDILYEADAESFFEPKILKQIKLLFEMHGIKYIPMKGVLSKTYEENPKRPHKFGFIIGNWFQRFFGVYP